MSFDDLRFTRLFSAVIYHYSLFKTGLHHETINSICGFTMGILFLAGCGKDSIKDTSVTLPGGSANFFANTEWTGVANIYGHTYPQPYYLRFNSDTTVSVYALFSWLVGNDIVEQDSTVGKITKINNATGGQTTVTIQYALSGDEQVLSFPV